ncbi:MAG: phospho-N-acetylmuramoyl-pentapeptide-transferase, partial [Rhodospirillaceae bacterium]|nr:phospho-N-acetylmuramoyl-pentapeptide-transferase [Rhodospirillaceae bacterium]
MLYNLLFPFADQIPVFNVFRYLTFRTGGAVMTSLIISFVIGPYLIRQLQTKQKGGQPIRDDGPEGHILTKQGTPTMGGLLILIASISSTLLWANIDNPFIWIALGVTASYGAIGFADDYLKVKRRDHKGLSGKLKLVFQFLVAVVAGYWIMDILPEGLNTTIAVPFFKETLLEFGFLFVVAAAFVMVGASNAVNLTDGLDGLAIVPVMIAAGVFALISYLVGNVVFAGYLQLHFVPGSGELAVFCGSLVGGGLGFLWFNAPPARIFMGDTGSLALGGALGTVSVITKHELVLAIVGGLFVLETVSVIVQVVSFKLTGKRVFAMAPLHHH